MKKVFQLARAVFMEVVMFSSQCHIANAAIPKKYWSYQQPFINAVSEKTILRLSASVQRL